MSSLQCFTRPLGLVFPSMAAVSPQRQLQGFRTETHGSCCLGNGYDRIQYMEDEDKCKWWQHWQILAAYEFQGLAFPTSVALLCAMMLKQNDWIINVSTFCIDVIECERRLATARQCASECWPWRGSPKFWQITLKYPKEQEGCNATVTSNQFDATAAISQASWACHRRVRHLSSIGASPTLIICL